MNVAKITISLDQALLDQIDRLVKLNIYPNRSQAVQAAIVEKIARFDRTRLARECAKLDPTAEQAMADEGLTTEVATWPEY